MNKQPMNPYHEFLRKVYRMRRAQKDFFKYKSKAMLAGAQSLERDVDKWLEQAGFEAEQIRKIANQQMNLEEAPKESANEP